MSASSSPRTGNGASARFPPNEQADGKDFRYVVKVPGKKQWKIHDSSGKFLKNTTAAKVAQMEKNAKAKKYADKKWGNESTYGLTVANVKAY